MQSTTLLILSLEDAKLEGNFEYDIVPQRFFSLLLFICLSHVQVQVGNVEVIEWRIRQHSDLTISASTGLLFQWDDSVPHNIFEMSTAVTSADECRFVGDSAYELGKVRNRSSDIIT